MWKGDAMVGTRLTRRTVLAAGAFGVAAPSWASLPPALARHPGFAAWSAPQTWPLPLTAAIDLGASEETLAAWLDGRPAVLSLWATWCGPCLAEKAAQAALARRLASAGARTRFLALQAYDDVSLADGRKLLKRLNAGDLENARASDAAEAAFIIVFGASPVDPKRTSLPSLLLIGADGSELARDVGMMRAPDGRTDYWAADSTFDFLSRLS